MQKKLNFAIKTIKLILFSPSKTAVDVDEKKKDSSPPATVPVCLSHTLIFRLTLLTSLRGGNHTP